MDIALVAHFDPPEIPKSDGYKELEKIAFKFLDIGEELAVEYNRNFFTTFCVAFRHGTDDFVIKKMAKIITALENAGHEVGAHTHVGINKLDDHIYFVAHDRLELMLHGHNVNCWSPGEWYHSGKPTIEALESAGYKYDLSVVPFFRPFTISDDKYTIDYSSCRQNKPYHPDYENLCKKGNAEILEVPILGLLDELRFGEGEFAPNLRTKKRLLDRINTYKTKYPNGIFQIVWHPSDFLLRDTAVVDELFLIRTKTFMKTLFSDSEIRFTTIDGHFERQKERMRSEAEELLNTDEETAEEIFAEESTSSDDDSGEDTT